MRPWRAAYDFRLWTRTVLSPDDDRRFERWALKNEDDYTALVRRYGENDDARAREDLLNSIQNMLWEGETHSFDPAFEDWDEGKEL